MQLLLNFEDGGGQRLTAAGSFPTSGSSHRSLSFSYRVRSGDQADGFTGSLNVTGTTTVEDGRRATLGGVSSSVRIDAKPPTLAPLVITSSAGADGIYVVDDDIEVTATFSEDVRRTSIGAETTLEIDMDGVIKVATLRSPSATSSDNEWVFRYTVRPGDSDADGVEIAANALDASLEDLAGNEAPVSHAAVAASTSHRVDTQGPRVVGLAITGDEDDDKLFLLGDTITATVTFDEGGRGRHERFRGGAGAVQHRHQRRHG